MKRMNQDQDYQLLNVLQQLLLDKTFNNYLFIYYFKYNKIRSTINLLLHFNYRINIKIDNNNCNNDIIFGK